MVKSSSKAQSDSPSKNTFHLLPSIRLLTQTVTLAMKQPLALPLTRRGSTKQAIRPAASVTITISKEGFHQTVRYSYISYTHIKVTNQTVVRFHEYTISIPELERQLLELPYIAEAHVLPVKDHGAGGLVAALVRLQKQEGYGITLKQIRNDLAATNLASYKLPTLLRVLQDEEEVPLTPSEKVLKRECLRKFFQISEYIPDSYAVEGVEYCGNKLDATASSRVFDWGGL